MSEKYHGIDCPKMDHFGEGYLHAADDDRPYDVDGTLYCGRCHGWLGIAATLSPQDVVSPQAVQVTKLVLAARCSKFCSQEIENGKTYVISSWEGASYHILPSLEWMAIHEAALSSQRALVEDTCAHCQQTWPIKWTYCPGCGYQTHNNTAALDAAGRG